MKRLISATLALTLLGSTAAFAAPFHPVARNDFRHETRIVHRGPAVFHRGDRFDFRRGGYAQVNDWRRYNLHRPMRGYHWVRYGNDYLMVALTTGLIADIMLHAR